MSWAEITGRRTQKAKHYRDSENPGHWRAELTIHDRHYHDGSAWQDIDESLVTDGQDGFDKRCDKTRHTLRIAGGGRRRWYPRRNVLGEYVEITEIQYFTNRWRTLNLPAVVWKSQGAEWDLSNLYASITNTWNKVKTEFILKDNTAPARLRFAVSFTGLTYNAITGELTSATDGKVWGSINKPIAYDANESSVPVTATYADGYIEWSADTSGATFPVYVDPTFQDGAGGDVNTNKDTYIRDTAATTNYGNAGNGWLGEMTVAARILRWLIQFDVSSISSSATCDSATLSIYAGSDDATNSGTLEVYRVLRSWVEGDGSTGSGATWNTYDGTNNWGTAGCSNTTSDRESGNIGTWSFTASETLSVYKSISLTASKIEELWDGTFTNNGFLIKSQSESDDAYLYNLSDNATESTRPKLVVTYTEATGTTVTPTAAACIASTTAPTAILGSLSTTPGVASAIASLSAPAVELGSAAATPATANAVARVVAPEVDAGGDIDVTPTAASCIVSVSDPGILFGSLSLTPDSASTVASVVNPTVIGGGAISVGEDSVFSIINIRRMRSRRKQFRVR